LPQAVEHGGGGDRMVENMPPAEPRDDIGHRLVVAVDAPPLRMMALQPADLGGHVAGIEDEATPLHDDTGLDTGDFRAGPPLHPGEAVAQRLALLIDGNATIELARDGECP